MIMMQEDNSTPFRSWRGIHESADGDVRMAEQLLWWKNSFVSSFDGLRSVRIFCDFLTPF
jgi:hypothetical protein